MLNCLTRQSDSSMAICVGLGPLLADPLANALCVARVERPAHAFEVSESRLGAIRPNRGLTVLKVRPV